LSASTPLWRRVRPQAFALLALLTLSVSPPAAAFVTAPAAEAVTARPLPAAAGGSLLAAREHAVRAERALESSTGGAWQVRWNERLGIASSGRGGPLPAARALAAPAIFAAAEQFRRQHTALLGSAAASLERTRLLHAGKAWHVTWQQRQAERRVVGALLDLTLARDGTVVAFHSTLLPALAPPPFVLEPEAARAVAAAAIGRAVELESSEAVIVPVDDAAGPSGVEAVEIIVATPSGGRWRALVEAEHQRLLALDSLVRESVLSGTARSLVQMRYAFEEPVDVVLPWLEVRLGFGENDPRTHTNGEGVFAFDADPGEVMLRSGLRGLYLSVDNEAPTGSPYYQRLVPVPSEVELRIGGAEARADERTVYYHANLMHDWLTQHFDFHLLDFPMPAVVAALDPYTGDPNYPNAYWNGTRMGFGLGGATYFNLGLFADVIYHEYTHAATEYIYKPGGPLVGPIGAAMHEGLSDYFAATVTDDPDLGELLYRTTPDPVRTLQNRLIWPEHRDHFNEPHANGRIFGGALWDTRERTGAAVADALVHYARELFPRSFEEFLEAMLLQDDLLFDDGWAGNGSPHREALLQAFGAHGMGPLGAHQLVLEHLPLQDSEAIDAPRPVVAHLRSFAEDDSGYVRLSYRVGSEGEFTHQDMQLTAGRNYTASIPGMPEGTQVEYYLAALRFDPTYFAFQPATAPAAVFSYRVGVDHEAPHLEHAPLVEVPAFGWPAELHVRLQDNLGVAYAYAEVWRGGQALGTVGLVPMSGDPDLYLGRFPNVGGAVGERFEYVLTAVDASQAGNSTRFPAQGRLEFVVVQDLLDDFERGAGSWRHRAVVLARPDPWQLTGAFHHGDGAGHAWLCGAESGELPAMTAAELQSAWLRLGNGGHASIWSWMEAEVAEDGSARDGGRIEIQAEGESAWSALLPEGGYSHAFAAEDNTNPLGPGAACLSGRESAWRQLHFDLTPWNGQRVRLRFLFGSDASVAATAHRGWLLDDFVVVPGAVDPTDAEEALPSRLQLQVGPNPFHPSLNFQVQVPPQLGRLQLEVLDARGRVLRRLLDAPLPAGEHRLRWDGRDAAGLAAAAGVYYYRLLWAGGLETGKVVLVR